MDSTKRLIFAILLSMLLVSVWARFFAPKPPEPDAKPTTSQQAATPLPTTTGTPTQPPNPVQEIPSDLPARQLKVETPEVSLLLTTEGAGLLKAELKGEKEREQEDLSVADGYRKLLGKTFELPPHIQLVNTAPNSAPFWATSFEGTLHLPDTLRYAVVEESPRRLVFKAEHAGLSLVKTFVFEEAGDVKLMVQLSNHTESPQSGTLWFKSPKDVPLGSEKEASFLGALGNQASVLCHAGGKLYREMPSQDAPTLSNEGPVDFVAVDQQYFLAALYVPNPTQSQCRLKASLTTREADLGFLLHLQPGETTSLQLKAYLGPKDLERLTSKGASLDTVVDFGWWAVICRLLLSIMRFAYQLLGNWGLAVIVLTVVVKLILLPLTYKGMVSAERMKKLQPQMLALREKYAKDRERLNMETMKLYQTAKINPLGGCLPLLVQMPVWFALFTTLRTSYELYREPFFGPAWTDLTSRDPTYLLPILLGVTMIMAQKLQPQMLEKTQAFMFTWIMPIFFSLIMLNYPAGLALYILVNNVLTIGQQFALRRWFEKHNPQPSTPAPTTTKTNKTAK